jgi:hypothetical protein
MQHDDLKLPLDVGLNATLPPGQPLGPLPPQLQLESRKAQDEQIELVENHNLDKKQNCR